MRRSSGLRIFLLGFLLSTQVLLTLSIPGLVHASNISFGPTINLSNDPTASGLPRIAATGNNTYVVWENNTLGKEDVLFRASNNNGTNFSPVIKLSNTPNGDASNPQIVAAGSNVYVVWQDNISATEIDVFFRTSTDNGASFGSAIDLCSSSSCGGVSGVTNSYVPQVGAAGSNVTVVWFAETTVHGKSSNNILAKTSTTNGSNLATVTTITLSGNAYPATVSLAPPQIAAQGKYVYATWSDKTSSGTAPAQTFFTASSNGGSSFSTSVSINTSPKTGETDVSQAMASAGNSVYVTWTNDTVSSDNTMFRASTNNGASFGTTMNFDKGNVTDLDPTVAAAGSNVYVVWSNGTSTGPQVLYRASNNNGASFSSIISLSNNAAASPQQTIAASGANVYVAWSGNNPSNSLFFASSSDNGLTFGIPKNLSPTTGSSLLPAPAIATAGTNVYVAWQDDTQGNGDIFFRTTGAIPDVAVAGISLSRAFAYSGVAASPIIVNVTVSNPGSVTASFTLTLRANATQVASNQTVTSLNPGASLVEQFSWSTGPLSMGNYILTAYISQVSPPGQTNVSHDTLTCPGGTGCGSAGSFIVRLKGDVEAIPDCKVDIADLAIVGGHFGRTLGQAGYDQYADLNNDGVTNISDLVIVASAFGRTC